jgi:undecaprenyl-diphosphatase
MMPINTASPCLHCHPPITPATMFGRWPRVAVALALLFASLALGAWIANGWLLLHWDEPVQRAVEAARTSGATAIVKRISFLGSTIAVLTLGGLLAAASWRRCRAVALVVLVATLSRPLLEFTLKALVDRDRPDLGRLVNGTGPSFPSGHVMAAAALWGLVPLVVTLYTRSRRIWWATTIVSATLIVAIGASRTYLGVHWLSDVVAGFIVGAFFLRGAEWMLARQHRRRPCEAHRAAFGAEPRPHSSGDHFARSGVVVGAGRGRHGAERHDTATDPLDRKVLETANELALLAGPHGGTQHDAVTTVADELGA